MQCLIGEKVCVMIIDSWRCTNVTSMILVEKLELKCEKHPKPYRLQWLNDSKESKVTNKVIMPFSIGQYVDEVTCNIVSMQVGHFLLGRP